jgi:hypothetical protein
MEIKGHTKKERGITEQANFSGSHFIRRTHAAETDRTNNSIRGMKTEKTGNMRIT